MKREHSPENVRLGKVVFFICVVLSMIAVTFCKGQVQRYNRFDNRDDVVTVSPKKSLRFPYKDKEIAVSIFVDSVRNGDVYVFMYAYIPDVVKDQTGAVTIKFDNEVVETLYPTLIDTMYKGYSYVEYFVPGRMYRNFVDHEYSYINFDGIKQYITLRPKSYFFKDFFAEFSGKK